MLWSMLKVSNQPATRLDVIQLQEALDQRLMERQAPDGVES